jgi:hypothetical protein
VPIIIDESDGDLEAFSRALALGYRGVSTKNCKGIMKSFLNRSLVERRNADRPEPARLFSERGGPHQCAGGAGPAGPGDGAGARHRPRRAQRPPLRARPAHCSPRERAAAVRHHGDLYSGDEREAWLRIENGRLRVGSLATAGYGVAFDPDLDAMIPLDRWTFDSLDAGC